MIILRTCPYLEYSFRILGRKWNALIIHYLSRCKDSTSHFSTIKDDLEDITPKSLSTKLKELSDFGLVEKNIVEVSPLSIEYRLTDKGKDLALAMWPIQGWATKYGDHDS